MKKDLRTSNIENNPYFASLPKMIQEGIMQSAMPIYSESDLRRLAENLIKESK